MLRGESHQRTTTLGKSSDHNMIEICIVSPALKFPLKLCLNSTYMLGGFTQEDFSLYLAYVKHVCLFVWCLTTHQPLWVISVRR